MEFNFSSFLALISFFLFLFIVLKQGIRSKTCNSELNLPPGPKKLPFIGNLHLFVGSLPHHALRDLAMKYGPLTHLQLGEVSTVVVSSAEAAKDVMKTHDIIFASRPQILAAKIISYGCTDIAFAPYGEYWRQLRKICVLELLSTKRVRSFRSIRKEEAAGLMRWIQSNAGTSINLTRKIYSSSMSIITKASIGKKAEGQETLISIAEEAVQLAAGFQIGDVYPSLKFLHLVSGMKPKLERLHKQVDRILENIINEHKKVYDAAKVCASEKNEDLIDVLLKFQDNEFEMPLTTDNIKAVLLDMFTAGSETSATTIDWAMSEMLKNPRVLEKAQDEVRHVFDGKGYVDEAEFSKLKYLKLVINETLRMHPAVPLLLPRLCGQRCVINGYDIPAGTRVIVNAWGIGRDPKYWEDAEIFKPERFLDLSTVDFKGSHFEYIPFGAGRRMCPGMTFGLANVELPLAILLYHFDWTLPNGMKPEELHMKEVFGATVRRKHGLFVIPEVKRPLHGK